MYIDRILSVGIIVSLSVAGTNLYHYLKDRNADQGIVSCSLATGDVKVISRDGLLRAVDRKTGEAAGFLERWPNGDIQLTTKDGFAPNVTPCLSGKLNTEQLNSLPLHG
ncbi:hypothetical protein [Serratia marcescens]|uniref:hypothetical protein n=1 Tax=Serratia marcescens TaxID=615 RepID=UPI0011F0E21B|nr:hypothetical protein [Serratia marcescens]